MIPTLDLLAVAKYGNVARKKLPVNFGIGAFSYVDGFGDALPALNKIAVKGCEAQRIHLMWKDGHGYTTKDFKYIKQEATRVRDHLIKKVSSHIPFYISGACENRLNAKNATDLYSMLMEVYVGLHNVNIVHSPDKIKNKGVLLKGVVNEIHGNDWDVPPGKFIYSYDGQNCYDANVAADLEKYKDALLFAMWGCHNNGNKNMKKEDTLPRAERTAYPTEEVLDSQIILFTPKGNTNLAEHFILKSHSEQTKDNTKEDKRANKVIMLAPIDVPFIHLVAANGRVVCELKKGDKAKEKYPVSRWIYRSPDWGYVCRNKAMSLQNYPTLKVMAQGKDYGNVNPAFRENAWR